MGDQAGATKAYAVVNRLIGEVLYPHIVAKCATCPAEYTRRANDTRDNPEMVAKRIRSEGWEFDEWRPGKTRCPACIEKRKASRRGESGKKDSNMATVVTLKGADNGTVRDLTVDERGKVREHLDTYFDVMKGIYTDGYTDHKVAAECKVPAQAVTKLRDTAYGPLKAIPALDDAQAELEALMQKTHAAKRAADEAENVAMAAKRSADQAVKLATESRITVEALQEQLRSQITRLVELKTKLGLPT